MVAAVAAVRGGDGALEARFVAVGERDDLPMRPNVDVRVAGRITSVEGSSFTVETLAGAEKMFSVDGSTVFRSRDGSVEGIEDLQPGMRAIVAPGQEPSDGAWLAPPANSRTRRAGRIAGGSLRVLPPRLAENGPAEDGRIVAVSRPVWVFCRLG
jgi:hypothetical protein